MPFSKDYYPLYGSKGSYREPNTLYLSVTTDGNGGFLYATICDDSNSTIGFESSRALLEYIRSLKSGSWIITYNLDFIAAVFVDLLDTFDKISGYSQDTRVVDLQYKSNKYYIIDAWQYFLDSFTNALSKSGFPISSLDRRAEETTPLDEFSRRRAVFIGFLWRQFRETVRDLFGVHPSKTPGATALKMWRTTLTHVITVKGDPINKFVNSSLTAGALYWKVGYYPNVYHYDLNAAYPFVMGSMRYPISLTGFANRVPPPGSHFIATVLINYHTERYFSPLTVRLKDKSLVHPVDAKRLRVTLTYIDVITLQRAGELEILDWLEGVYWYPDEELDLFSDWKTKVESRILEKPEDKMLLKVSSRALHSKFAQRPGAPRVEIYRADPLEVLRLGNKIADLYPLPDGGLAIKVLTRKKPKFQNYIHPYWEALTLSMGRYLINMAIDEDTIYVDTDSIISTKPRPDLPIGKQFGTWKLDKTGNCWIVGPRMYIIGNNSKASGINPVSRSDLYNALRDALAGRETVIQAIEQGSLIDPSRAKTIRDHSIRLINFGHTETIGNRAYITRSPTVEEPIKRVMRYLS